MTSSIDRLTVRWRPDAVPDGAARLRLDALVSAVREEDALAGAVPGDALVCVRRVEVEHRMRWDLADAELVAGWAAALGAAVGAAAGSAPQHGRDVVRYPHRAALRADVVASVLCGDRERAWAWTLLGLPSDDDAVVLAAVSEAALAGPAAVVSLTVAAARTENFWSFVDLIGESVVVALAGQVWADAGGSPLDAARTRPDTPGMSPDPISGSQAIAALVVRRSEVFRATRSDRASGAHDRPVETVRALAMLAVLEVEPTAARRPGAAQTVAELASIAQTGKPGPQNRAEPGLEDRVERGPEDRVEPGSENRREQGAQALRESSHGPEPLPASDVPDVARAHDPDPAAALVSRPCGATSWGGLLFLLPLVADIGLPDRALAEPALRPQLYELARLLLIRAVPDSAPDADPALLAFCGLAPDADPPDRPGEAAREALHRDADALIAALAARLGRDGDDRALLLATTRRAALIEAEPGWIDVRLDIDEVTLEVRRAGLDLDPGYLPWLGCVVRFRYE